MHLFNKGWEVRVILFLQLFINNLAFSQTSIINLELISKNFITYKIEIILSIYIFIVVILRLFKNISWFNKLLYWIIGLPFVIIGFLFFSNIRGENLINPSRSWTNKETDNLSSNSSNDLNIDKERVEIQYQQKGGNWRTLQIVNNNLDQTIAHGMNSVNKIISRQTGNTGRIRAKGLKTGTIYDIR